MKKMILLFFYTTIGYSNTMPNSIWRNECVGYYTFSLPNGADVALYPLKGFLAPKPKVETNGFFIVSRYAANGITFGREYDISKIDTAQAQFSSFYYGKYRLGISSKSSGDIDFNLYKKKRIDSFNFNIETQKNKEELDLIDKPITVNAEFKRKHQYIIKDYINAFVNYDYSGYKIYINSQDRLYHFWSVNSKDTGNKSQTAEAQLRNSEPEVISLLKRFRSRDLFEIPSEKGFCLPYGFIAGDSGHEPRNMAVMYRLKAHPDVTIFFQDLGMKPKAGKEDDLNDKDYVSWLWNWQYQWSAVSKELIKPKWRTIKMDGRTGLGTFVKAIYKDVPVYDSEGHVINHINYINYGYVAYVRGDHKARNVQPDLLLYVMQDSRQAKNNPPMNAQEIEQMAEHIISTVRRR